MGDGSSAFWLENTTITGDGTIAVENGTLECAYRNSTGADCTLNIGASGTLRIDNDVTLTVKNFHNGGTYFVHSTAGLGMLVVTGTLTPGNQVSKLTLVDGATVKASAITAKWVDNGNETSTLYIAKPRGFIISVF